MTPLALLVAWRCSARDAAEASMGAQIQSLMDATADSGADIKALVDTFNGDQDRAHKLERAEDSKRLTGKPEIAVPLYFSTPDRVAVIGPEGQFQHVDPTRLTDAQLMMMKDLGSQYFDASGHVPTDKVVGMCKQGYRARKDWDEVKMEECIATVSRMTPTHMEGLHQMLETYKPDGFTGMGGRISILSCDQYPDNLVMACKEVIEPQQDKQGPAHSCPRMTIDGHDFSTTHFAFSVDKLSPFFTKARNKHYFNAEKNLHLKYHTKPNKYGCGVYAKTSFRRGDLIGLAGVAHATYMEGMVMALQETPWLGTNMNHCPGDDSINGANTALKLAERPNAPTSLWLYANRDIKEDEEITLDYNQANKQFPYFIMGAPKDWTCGDSKEQAVSATIQEIDRSMRRAGPL